MQLQRGMNFRPRGRRSVILMSVRDGAPYADHVEEGGRVIIYEGHDAPRRRDGPNPKTVDQPEFIPSGKPTENGKFAAAARAFKDGECEAELVNVYEKIKPGIWVFNGVFRLVDSWTEEAEGREVFKFRLEISDEIIESPSGRTGDLDHLRVIPSSVKLEVWKRDGGKCTKCGSEDNLHFDHILPYSKGGSSLVAENIQLLCARHNLKKSDRIE
ncbi:MAG: HNH endonuclease [Verrucomicrobia bacterium]|nr:HNH endonuclease [Verrucomicrobiota bacterium]